MITNIGKLFLNLAKRANLRYCSGYTATSNKETHIVWMDLEMTDINIDVGRILEIACLVTDKELNVVSDELSLVIHQPENVLKTMNDWCKVQHGKTGLTGESLASKIMLKDAEEIVLNYLKKHVPKQTCPLAGNTIYMDRMFLYKYMPSIDSYMHYRMIDVSTIKELVKRWNIDVYTGTPQKSGDHRAIFDIKDSIEELKYYRKHVFR